MIMRKKFKLLAAAVAMAAAATLVLTGCSGGGADPDKPFKVIAFTSGNQTPVGAWWVKAVTAKAEELGWDLTMIQGDFDFQKMNPAVESAIGQGADVIFDGYTDYASIGSIVAAAKEANIPMFAMDSGTEATDAFVSNVTTDQQGIVDETVGAITEKLGGSSWARTSWLSATIPTRVFVCVLASRLTRSRPRAPTSLEATFRRCSRLQPVVQRHSLSLRTTLPLTRAASTPYGLAGTTPRWVLQKPSPRLVRQPW